MTISLYFKNADIFYIYSQNSVHFQPNAQRSTTRVQRLTLTLILNLTLLTLLTLS